MEEKRVVVTGLGVISAVGNDVASFWQALLNSRSGIGPITTFDASAFESRIAGEVKGFDPAFYGITSKDTKRIDKFGQYAVAASKQAIADSGLDLEKEDRDRIGVIIGTGIGSIQTMERECRVYFEKLPSRL